MGKAEEQEKAEIVFVAQGGIPGILIISNEFLRALQQWLLSQPTTEGSMYFVSAINDFLSPEYEDVVDLLSRDMRVDLRKEIGGRFGFKSRLDAE